MPDLPYSDDLRIRLAAWLREHRDVLVADVDHVLTGFMEVDLPAQSRHVLAGHIVDLIAAGLAGGGADVRSALPALAALEDKTEGLAPVFSVVHLAERAILDETALDETLGARSAWWSQVEQSVRHSSFQVLAAYCESRQARSIDPLTGLVSGPVFRAALQKELERATRHRRPLAIILFDIDGFSEINRVHGHGVGDRVLERLGVFVQKYFRLPDWVARHGADSVAVLLGDTDQRNSRRLTEGARQTIEKRLVFGDRRDRPVRVTVSAALLTLSFKQLTPRAPVSLDAGRLMAEAEAGLQRAKAAGGNLVEHVEMIRPSLSLSDTARLLGRSRTEVRQLAAGRVLPAHEERGRLRFDLDTVKAYVSRTPGNAGPAARTRGKARIPGKPARH